MRRACFLLAMILAMAACSRTPSLSPEETRRIISLDYCADQYVLKLVDRSDIAGLSPDAEKIFSYYREEAAGLATVRPRAEDILIQKPDIVVRTYGGGPNITALLNRIGVEVVQIPYAADLAGVKSAIKETANALDAEQRGNALIEEMDRRIDALHSDRKDESVLYLTSRGAVAGEQTMLGELINLAGFENFQTAPGWTSIPLERLAYEKPDIVAAGFFDTHELVADIWTPARHPVAQRQMKSQPAVDIPSAWTACGAWFLLDAVEAMAAHKEAVAS